MALRAAAEDALDAVARAPLGLHDLDALADHLLTAQAALETLSAFVAVDFGKLEEVPR